MKSLIIFAAVLCLASAQVFDWSGRWDTWDVVPRNSTIRIRDCCRPETVKITQNSCNPYLIDVKLHFTEEQTMNCPGLKEEVEVHETIINGQFNDVRGHSHLFGSYGLYRPNNDTIWVDPGPTGNCVWILGNEKSIVTNTSDVNDHIEWSGDWKVDDVYPAAPKVVCCKPEEPITITQDLDTNTIAFEITWDKDAECDLVKNTTIQANLSSFGGGFIDKHVRGFFLRNESILIECGECVTILSKADSYLPMLQVMAKEVITESQKKNPVPITTTENIEIWSGLKKNQPPNLQLPQKTDQPKMKEMEDEVMSMIDDLVNAILGKIDNN